MLNIKYPVRVTEDFQILDAENKTVVPDLLWKGDLDHKKRQREVGLLIARVLNDNDIAENVERVGATREEAKRDLVSVANSDMNNANAIVEPKKRNPWGRAGKPK